MRLLKILTTAALGMCSSAALGQSVSICFINNSSANVEIGGISLPPGSGDQDKCVANEIIQAQITPSNSLNLVIDGVDLTTLHSQGNLGVQLDGDSWYFGDGNVEFGPVATGPGNGAFGSIPFKIYFGSDGDEPLPWPEHLSLFTTKYAINWSLGDDGVYRVVVQPTPPGWPAPPYGWPKPQANNGPNMF